jgi:hypothetical protein
MYKKRGVSNIVVSSLMIVLVIVLVVAVWVMINSTFNGSIEESQSDLIDRILGAGKYANTTCGNLDEDCCDGVLCESGLICNEFTKCATSGTGGAQGGGGLIEETSGVASGGNVTDYRVFVTNQSYDANLSGLEGADTKCQEAAVNAGLNGTWKAYIGKQGTSPESRIYQSSVPYKRLDGTTVANDYTDLTDGKIAAQINIDEFGQLQNASYFYAWTGSSGADGKVSSCRNWTYNNKVYSNGTWVVPKFWTDYGSAGIINWPSNRQDQWYKMVSSGCHVKNRLYCIEQPSQSSQPSCLSSEICNNDADDNCDGLIDCEDSACNGKACSNGGICNSGLCFNKATATGMSCTTYCQSIGKSCLQENWNDGNPPAVCDYFYPNHPVMHSGSDGAPSFDSGYYCRPRISTVNQNCDSTGFSNSIRFCVCEKGNEEISNNTKNMNLYSNKQTFLVSDNDWKEVLPYVPVAVWTGNENCQQGYGTAENVCAYPFLIYQSEQSAAYNLSEVVNPTLGYGQYYSVNGKSVVRFYLDETSKREFLTSSSHLDIASVGDTYADVVLDEEERKSYESKGFNMEIIPTGYVDDFNLSAYHSYDEMVAELYLLQDTYPSLARVYDLGDSIQGRDILAIKISDNVDTDEEETEILVQANHHARELMTVEVPLFMANYLLENYDKTVIKNVVDNHELWFIPMANPDGHVIVETTDSSWRKNARDNNGDGSIDYSDGVDLNRNYGYTWGYDDMGSSPYPSDSSYRGTSEFSEPETQAIRDFVLGRFFSYALDYHASGGYILYPWGHLYEPTPDDAVFESMANGFNTFLNYKSDQVGQIYEVIYPSNGDSIDWFYGNKSILAFGFELNPNLGFAPDESYIQPTCEEQMLVLLNLTGVEISPQLKEVVEADSLVYFLQQYSPTNLTLIGETHQEIDNLLVAARPLGASLNTGQIDRINLDSYLGYWQDYQDVVYVEDYYTLALLASAYASLINAPLIIRGSSLDNADTYSGKRVICVGSTVGSIFPSGGTCDVGYNYSTLQSEYLAKTQTKKIALINPYDLSIYGTDSLQPDKTGEIIRKIYSKTSLAAPILAAAKHELIVSSEESNYQDVDFEIEEFSDSAYDYTLEDCSFTDTCAAGFANNPVNMAGATSNITFFLTGNADILVDGFQADNLMVGAPAELGVTIFNAGFDEAENIVLEAYWMNESSPPSGGGGGGGDDIKNVTPLSFESQLVLIGIVNVGTLLEDEFVIANVSWTPPEAGDEMLYFNVSTSSNESSTENNIVIYSAHVSGPEPDLALSVEHTGKMKINSQNSINITVDNIGTSASEQFDVSLYRRYWDNNNLVEEEIGNANFAGLAPGASVLSGFEFTPTENRWYEFRAVVVPSGQDAVSYNNEEYFSIRAATDEPSIGYGWNIDNPLILGQEFNFSIYLNNEGFEAARNVVVDYYLRKPSDSDYIFQESRNIGDLSDNNAVLIYYLTPLELDLYEFKITVSYEYNGGTNSLQFWASKKANMAGPNLEVWGDANNAELGENIAARANIENRGTDTAENVILNIYDNGNLVNTQNLGSLPPDNYLYRYVNWTPIGIGAHEIKFKVDCTNEVDLSDNEDIATVQVYKKRNVTFNIINSSSAFIETWLGLGYDLSWEPSEIYLINSPTLTTIPDIQTDIWVMNTENISSNDYVYAIFRESDLHSSMFTISQDYQEVREQDGKRLYRTFANEVFWNYYEAEARFSYSDYTSLGITNTDNLTLYYCENWDFDYEICLTGWKEAFWVNKNLDGNKLFLRTSINSYSVEAFAIGEPLTGTFSAEFREPQTKPDSSGFYRKVVDYGEDAFGKVVYYYFEVPGFLYNCGADTSEVKMYLNDIAFPNTIDSKCYNSLPMERIVTPLLNTYTSEKIKNVTLSFNGSLIFYDSNSLIRIFKGHTLSSFGEDDSSGISTIPVNAVIGVGDSEFTFINKNYTSFVVDTSSPELANFDVSINGINLGEIDLINSNGRKAREFRIPYNLLDDETFNVSLVSLNPGKTYIADVEMKTNFDDYYLTIFASPDAISFQDSGYNEADFRTYGDLNGDLEGEYSVGRIMGITSSDVSSYLARVLFFDKLPRQTGGVIMMVGDGYSQRIPVNTCGTGFCRCYYDDECPELFARYQPYFSSYETCSQDLINGTQQTTTSDCNDQARLENAIYNQSNFVMYGDHGFERGWPGLPWKFESSNLDYLPPEFAYSFACSTCGYGPYSKANLFCTNMIRKGATGYIGAIEPMYGHHFFNEFLDETLINNQSIGYAFKVGKNKEARFDWKTPNVEGDEYLREEYGVHDILIGDPTFTGGIGI